MEFKHISVLLKESIDSLQIKPGGVYADATAGGGGHSGEILKALNGSGRLIAIDRDPDACENLRQKFAGCSNVTVVNRNFNEIASIRDELGIKGFDGILADLGVSSYQLDTAERGFSFHKEAPLDMRMSKAGISAADVVNTYSEQQLASILFTYGEEKFARSIAAKIVRARNEAPIQTTTELAEIIKSAMPAKAKREGGHPARRSFQALRIEVNSEIDSLPGALEEMFNSLTVGGRLSVITFHSLEDKAVKTKFKEFTVGCVCPRDFPVCVCGKTPRGELAFRYITPGEKEITENARARSAKLRSIIKLK